jgi:hypothetical protein
MITYPCLTLDFLSILEPLRSIRATRICDPQSKVSFSQTQNPPHRDVIDGFSIASPLTDDSPYSAITIMINRLVRIDVVAPSCRTCPTRRKQLTSTWMLHEDLPVMQGCSRLQTYRSLHRMTD